MRISNFGEEIRTLREKRKMTQKQLGEFLGYSESYISYIEKGERTLNINDIEKLTKLFDVDFNHFLQPQNNKTHFRASTNNNDGINYEKMLEDFDKHVGKQL